MEPRRGLEVPLPEDGDDVISAGDDSRRGSVGDCCEGERGNACVGGCLQGREEGDERRDGERREE